MPKRRSEKLKPKPAKRPAAVLVNGNHAEEEDRSWEKIFTEELSHEEKSALSSQWVEVECPFCGENFDVHVSVGEDEGQEMVQDCQVCCKPVQLYVDVEEGEVTVSAERG